MKERLANIVSAGFELPKPGLPLIEQLQYLIDQCLPGTLGVLPITI